MNDADLDALLAWAEQLARDAGDVMREYFNSSQKGTETKRDKTPVTEADKKINDKVIARVTQDFPHHGVLGEEASANADREKLWVCDPIDGTEGFILGLPIAMFSLAFVVDGEPMVAVMYEPLLDKMFTAIKGKGSLENGEPIHVSETDSLNGSNIAFSPRLKQFFSQEAFYRPVVEAGVRDVLITGEAFRGGLTASGRIDAHIFPGRSAHDTAALKLIVEEAGGKVTDLRGNEQRYDQKTYGAIVSNGYLHDQLVKLVGDYGPEKYVGY